MSWGWVTQAGASHSVVGSSQIDSETASQQLIRLTAGWNYISFQVIPDDSNFEAILADILADVELVKNAAGSVYAPAYGIDQLSPADPHQGYKIKALKPVTLTVSGTVISPEAMPLDLNTGWNLIPYFRSGPMAIEEALASILPEVVQVEDGMGRVYPPKDDAPVLSTLIPGRSYAIFIDQPVTMTYPDNTIVSSGPLEVNTLAEALDLNGLQVGEQVDVAGYYAPGDGGGGIFTVEDSGCMTDGGTCFGFNEHLSDEVQETFPYRPYALKLEHENIAFATVSLDVLDNTGSTVLAINGRHLHGHRYGNSEVQRPLVDYGNGVIDGIYRNTPNDYFWRFNYRYLTSNLRLVRQNVGNTLDVHWFGAKTSDVDPNFDNQPVICQAINAAISRGDVTTVLVSKPGVYEYFGTIELGDGLTLKGAGGTELVTATDDFGNTFHPVRIKEEHTRLRVKDGEATKHMRMQYLDASHPNYLPGDAKWFLGTRQSVIWTASGAMSGTLEDIVLDGNWEENQEALQDWDGYGGFDAIESELRNSPAWAGFVATNHGGNVIPLGQHVTVRNIAVLGYGSNGLLGNANNVWTGENVLLGNCVWNHVWYNAGGTWTNLTMTGFSWTHGDPSWGTVYNLVYERGTISPYRPSKSVLNIRGPDIYDDSETPVWPYVRSDGSWIPIGFEVDGFYIDGRDGNITIPFKGLGPNVVFQNGVYIHPGDENNGYFYIENGNGFQKALYPNNRIENVTIYETGAFRGHLLGRLNVTESEYKNIRVINKSSEEESDTIPLHSEAHWRNHPSWQNSQTVVFDGIIDESHRNFLLKTNVHPDAAGRDIYIKNSSFNNQTNAIVIGPSHQGALDLIEGDLSKLHIFFENVELNVGMDTYWQNLEIFFNNGYFRNVTASNSGRTSEDSGTILYTATGGETYIDAPTNLFWVPEQVSVIEGGGAAGLYDRYEVTHPDDDARLPYKTEPSLRIHLSRPLNSGENVAFTWSAAVHPFPDDYEDAP